MQSINNEKQEVNVKKTLKWVIISLVTIVTIVILAGIYKFNYLASQEGYDCDGNKITTPAKNI